MKKTLSIILALTLAFSLLPTFAMATETTETEIDWSESIVFDFGSPTDPKSTALAETKSRTLTTSSTAAFYGENYYGWYTKTSSNILAGDDANESTVVYKPSNERLVFNVRKATIDQYNTYSFTLNIPANGIYDISTELWNSATGGTMAATIDDESIGTLEFFGIKGDANDGYGKTTREFSAGKAVAVAKLIIGKMEH